MRNQGAISGGSRERGASAKPVRRFPGCRSQAPERLHFRCGSRDLKPFVASLPHGLVQAVTRARRCLAADRPLRVVVAATGSSADESETLLHRAAGRAGGAGDALEQKNALVGEPEMLGQGRRGGMRLRPDEASKEEPKLAQGISSAESLRGASQFGHVLSHAPGLKEGKRQNCQRGPERPVRLDVHQVTAESLLRTDLLHQDPFPGDAQRPGAQEDVRHRHERFRRRQAEASRRWRAQPRHALRGKQGRSRCLLRAHGNEDRRGGSEKSSARSGRFPAFFRVTG